MVARPPPEGMSLPVVVGAAIGVGEGRNSYKISTHVDFNPVHHVRRLLRVRLGHIPVKLLVFAVPLDGVQQGSFQLEVAPEHGRLAADLVPWYHRFHRQSVACLEKSLTALGNFGFLSGNRHNNTGLII